MKKNTKLLSCITSMAIITAGAGICNLNSVYGHTVIDDFNNAAYQEYISNFEVAENEEWLMEIDWHEKSPLHVYITKAGLAYEYSIEDSIRTFESGYISALSGDNVSVTKDELNAFLKSKGINATVRNVSVYTDENGDSKVSVSVTRVEGDSALISNYSSIVEGCYALSKEYGFTPNLIMASSYEKFAEVKGDANGSGELDVRDAALIASSLVNDTPLYDNADFNQDGEINVRDAAAIAKSLAQITN